MAHVENVYGEPIEAVADDPDDIYWVPPGERVDHDHDPDANALLSDPDDPDSGDDDLIGSPE